jgi:hypothetical protein
MRQLFWNDDGFKDGRGNSVEASIDVGRQVLFGPGRDLFSEIERFSDGHFGYALVPRTLKQANPNISRKQSYSISVVYLTNRNTNQRSKL